MQEIFKDISGYEGLYTISNTGKVISLSKNDGNGYRDRELIQEIIKRNHTNYRRVTLSKNGKTKRFQVHRLVAIAFLENSEKKPFVNHIDSNGENNNVKNLEWNTQKENMEHSKNKNRSYSTNVMQIKQELATKKRIENRNEKSKINFGKTFGFVKILEETREKIGNYKFGHNRFQYKCLCTRCNFTESWKEIYLLKSGKYVQCQSCTKRYGKENLETLKNKGIIE